MYRSTAARAALLFLALVLATACAASGGAAGTGPSQAAIAPSPSPSASSAFPVTVEAANGDVTLDAPPEAIVSLSPTATEMLFAVGAGDQTVAVDSFSNFPAEAPTTDLSASEPNIEAIAGYAPDLVVFADGPEDLEPSLAELDIPVLQLPAATTLDDTYAQIAQIGAVTGNSDGAATLIEQMSTDIGELIAGAPSPAASATVYHELDDTYYSATSATFIGQLYGMLGLGNIADEAEGAAGDYPQLSSEYIIDANPTLIFLADTECCGQTAETVAQRPGWDEIDAVAGDGVIELDDDVASRWGPRVVDLLETIAAAVETHVDAGGS